MSLRKRRGRPDALKAWRRPVSTAVFAVWICLTLAALSHYDVRVAAKSADRCVECHRQQKDVLGRVVSIFQTSAHRRAGVGCDGCHGGDASQSDKNKAHAGQFIARPNVSATLEMCGACHSQPLEFFKKSKHLAAQANARRLDCAECHGVHGIGAASETFRWPQFCTGCHGLEYLPQLPGPFQQMLALADDLREGLHGLESKGRATPELVERRKEIRHMISELVHQTDSKGGAERIPRILDLGASLKQRLAAEAKR